MQFETFLLPRVCPCLRLSLCHCACTSACGWVCVGPAVGGEVSVKSVLFSPVGRIRSLQICTAGYRDRGHSRCRCRRSLQRRVSGRGARGGRPGAAPPSSCHHFRIATRGHPGFQMPADPLRPCAPPPSRLFLSLFGFDPRLPLSLFLIPTSLLFHWMEVLQKFPEVLHLGVEADRFPFCPFPNNVEDRVTR